MADYGMHTTVAGGFDAIKERVVAALKEQGFGILTTIDVQGVLKEKLGAEMERYEILGACNPQLAHQALGAERDVGLLLPCNVVLREADGAVEVGILDPREMFRLAGADTQAKLAPLASDARARLERALTEIGGADGA